MRDNVNTCRRKFQYPSVWFWFSISDLKAPTRITCYVFFPLFYPSKKPEHTQGSNLFQRARVKLATGRISLRLMQQRREQWDLQVTLPLHCVCSVGVWGVYYGSCSDLMIASNSNFEPFHLSRTGSVKTMAIKSKWICLCISTCFTTMQQHWQTLFSPTFSFRSNMDFLS